MRGLAHGIILGQGTEGIYCPPAGGFSPETVKDIVLGYMAAHPSQMHEEGGELAALALLQAYRCKP